MADGTDFLILIYSADLSTILTDPIGAAPYQPRLVQGSQVPFFLNNTPGWRSIDLSPRRNEAGMGTFTCNATAELLSVLQVPEVRAAVIRDVPGQTAYIEMAGPIETPVLDYDAERDGSDGLGVLTVQFTDDLAQVASRKVYPNPAQASTGQTTTTKYVVTATNAETAARAMVSANAGPTALAGRRFPELALAAAAGVGTTVSASFTRAVGLMDALRYLLFIGGDLTMRTYQDQGPPTRVLFEVSAPVDRSATVWFSRDLGNIRKMTYERGAPTATAAIVGDATAGTARVVRERTNATALAAGWRRRETFVDGRSAQNATELDTYGDKELEETGPVERLTLEAIETAQQQYPFHYRIGDIVSAEPFLGRVIKAVVRGVDIKATPDRGETVTPLIGSDSGAEIDLKASQAQRQERRLTQLEDAAGIA